MWLFYGIHLLYASIPAVDKDQRKVIIDFYSLSESGYNDGQAILQHQRQLSMTTLCSHEPRILDFQTLFSKDRALMLPHLFIYDSGSEQLECHCFDLDSQSTTARVGVRLNHIDRCYIVSGKGILLVTKDDQPNQTSTYDLFEWIPEDQKLLLGHLNAENILGVSNNLVDCPWSLLYTSPNRTNCVSAALGSAIMRNTHVQDNLLPIIQVNDIPTEYRNNLQNCYISGSLENGNQYKRIWAHTLSNELVFIEDGALRWSIPFAPTVRKFVLGEFQSATQNTPKLCLCVYTDMDSVLYDALSGLLLQEWSRFVLLADVWGEGVDVAIVLPNYTHLHPMKCELYPAVRMTRQNILINSSEETKERAISSLNTALGSLEGQLALKQKRIERLQASLFTKQEIIKDCQEMLSGPLRFTFLSGLGSKEQLNSALSQKKRDQRRKQLLSRLVPIVGSTVTMSFDTNLENCEFTADKADFLEILECTAGWISSASRNLIWFGVKVVNTSTLALFHLWLSVAQNSSCGYPLSRLDGQGTGKLIGYIEVDMEALSDDDLLDKSKALSRLLTRTVMLHYSLQEKQNNNESLSSFALVVPRFNRLDMPPVSWKCLIDEMVLPAKNICYLNSDSRNRVVRLLQDGLGLPYSPEDDQKNTRFGSIEDDLVARIFSACAETELKNGDQEKHTSWNVCFYAPTETLATMAARKATLLFQRFR